MTIRRTLPILALVAAIAVTGTAFARGPHGHGGGPGGGPGGMGPGMGPDLGRFVHHLTVVLDLDDAQLTQIESITTAARDQVEPLATQLADARDAWRDANPLGTFDEAAFRQHFESQSDLHVELAVIVHRAMNDVWNVLTPDQQAQAQAMMDRVRDRRGDGNGGKRGFFGRGHRGDCPFGNTD